MYFIQSDTSFLFLLVPFCLQGLNAETYLVYCHCFVLPNSFNEQYKELNFKMVAALTFLSCCVAARILFLWSAMTGCSPLHATLQYFLALIKLFLILTTVLQKDEHLYFILQLQPSNPIGGNKDQMIVCTIVL